MIISQDYGFAFIHNPKVAGTSVRNSIEHFHDYHKVFWHQGYVRSSKRVHDLAHIPFQDLDSEEKLMLNRVFTFGFVREPLSRFYSAYAEFKRQHADWYPSTLDIDDFVQLCQTEANVKHDWRFVHFCPQHLFFYNFGFAADFIGRHENFQEDWATAQKLGKFQALPLSNSRHREKPEEPKLNAASLQVLQRLYEKDCRTFGYAPLSTNVKSDTHEYRVEQIHNPDVMHTPNLQYALTPGELVAYKKTPQPVSKQVKENEEA